MDDEQSPTVEGESAGKPASDDIKKKGIIDSDPVLPLDRGEPYDIQKKESSSVETSQSGLPVAIEEYDPEHPEIPEELLRSLSLHDKEEFYELEHESQSSEASFQSEINWEDLNLSNEKQVYVNYVKKALGENSDEYNTFKKLVLQHETIRIGSLKFRRWARWILKEHTELINGLNVFLPCEIHITNSSPTEYSTELFQDFVKLIKKHYQDYMKRSAVFVKIKKKNVAKEITDENALSLIADLFADHPELVAEFNKFE